MLANFIKVNTENPKTCAIIFILGVVVGWSLFHFTHKCPTAPAKVEYVDRVRTEIAYVPKEIIPYKDGTTAREKVDVDMQLGKQDLNVRVNGKEMTFQKTKDEQFVLDKNKLSLTQSSTATLDIKVPTIDKTKRWGIGVGASSRKPVGIASFPLTKRLDGWVVGNEEKAMGGVMFRF